MPWTPSTSSSRTYTFEKQAHELNDAIQCNTTNAMPSHANMPCHAMQLKIDSASRILNLQYQVKQK